MKIVQADLNKIKEVLVQEYAPTLGFMVEDPMFVGAVLYLRDHVSDCSTEEAVRRFLPKPCPSCLSKIEHDCELKRIVSKSVKRVRGLRIVRDRPEILRTLLKK